MNAPTAKATEGDNKFADICGGGEDDRTTGDICYTGPETLTGVTPGNPVWVSIWGATDPCPDSPTTGTLTVVG